MSQRDESLPVWRNQYLNEFWDTRDPLLDLALSYLKETEDYDHSICAARKGNIAIPVTREERRACTQHAAQCMARHLDRAHEMKLLGKGRSFREAIHKVQRQFEMTYQPPDS